MSETSIFIRGKLPSLNEYVLACRNNRFSGAKMKKAAEEMILLQFGSLKQFDKPVRINFIWHEETRRRDKDNVAFAKKFILDALQKSGKLPNDNNRYIDGFSDSFVYGKEQGVLIEVIEV